MFQVEELVLSAPERKGYDDFEEAVKADYMVIRWRLRNAKGSHTMDVLSLLAKFRQVM